MEEDIVVVENRIENETRIDEFAIQAFQSMGFNERLTDNMVTIYKAFKGSKDRLHPGRVSPEGFATIAVLAGMADGTIKMNCDREA